MVCVVVVCECCERIVRGRYFFLLGFVGSALLEFFEEYGVRVLVGMVTSGGTFLG